MGKINVDSVRNKSETRGIGFPTSKRDISTIKDIGDHSEIKIGDLTLGYIKK